MIRLAAALLVCALGVTDWAGESRADTRRAPADVRAVIPGSSLANSTLVGRSGQLYLPQSGGGWKREGRGGVACDVRGAYKLSGKLWAVCSWAPLFVREGALWSARPLPNRGRSRVAEVGGKLYVSVGRHIYTWRGDWKRTASAPGRLKSFHAMTTGRMWGVTTRRQLVRANGTNWSVVIDRPGRRDKNADPAARVFGSARHVYAVTENGELRRIDGSRLAPVALPSGVSSVDIGATLALADGDVLASASLRRGTSTRRGLVKLSGGKLELAEGPSLHAGERVGLLYQQGAELLLATRAGRVFIRGNDGSWTAQTVDNSLPAAAASAANGGPAPTK